MNDEVIADSGFDMEAAGDELSSSLFDSTPEEVLPEAITEEVVEEVVEETLRAAPQSWKKEMHESWGSLPPEVQEYIDQRENQMKEGLEKDRGDANLGRMMRDVMTPYSEMLQQQGVDEPTMVKTMMNAHYRLSTASPEEKAQLFNQLAQNYGVSLNGEQPQQADPVIKQLQDELNSIKSNLSAKDQEALQAAKDRVGAEVEAFASDPEHSYFDEVSDDLIPYLNAGYSLQDAYEKAVWANPVTRQKEQDRIQSEKEAELREKANDKANKAKKAKSANVRTRDTKAVPTEPLGTMEDTMHETLREIQNRN